VLRRVTSGTIRAIRVLDDPGFVSNLREHRALLIATTGNSGGTQTSRIQCAKFTDVGRTSVGLHVTRKMFENLFSSAVRGG